MTVSEPVPAEAAEPVRRRGRPRSAEADVRIVQAALAEYAERGWSGFTLDAVARRAGVGKSSLYLRWPGKEDLLADAVRSEADLLLEVDTGSLRTDLEALASSLLAYLLRPSGFTSLRIAVDAAGSSEALGSFVTAQVHPHVDSAGDLIRRATERGEIPKTTDVATTVNVLYGGVLVVLLSLPPEERNPDEAAVAKLVQPVVEFVLAALTR